MSFALYWKRPGEISREVFARICQDVQVVLAAMAANGLKLTHWDPATRRHADGPTIAIAEPACIAFNGDNTRDETAEEFVFERRLEGVDRGGLCKTDEHPYNRAAKAVLYIAHRRLGDAVEWHDDNVWRATKPGETSVKLDFADRDLYPWVDQVLAAAHPAQKRRITKSQILITDLGDPAFHANAITKRLQESDEWLVASLITKRPAAAKRILSQLASERAARVFVQCTITGLGGTAWEPHVISGKQAFEEVRELVAIAPDRVSLRYDPIVPGVNDHDRWFRLFCQRAKERGISAVTVSILDVYDHKRQEIARVAPNLALPDGMHWPLTTRQDIVRRFKDAADAYGILLRACCEPGIEGLQRGGCDWIYEAVERTTGGPVAAKQFISGMQRKACGCPEMTQLIPYSAKCGHGCVYCYKK